jgi:hypothetical protein
MASMFENTVLLPNFPVNNTDVIDSFSIEINIFGEIEMIFKKYQNKKYFIFGERKVLTEIKTFNLKKDFLYDAPVNILDYPNEGFINFIEELKSLENKEIEFVDSKLYEDFKECLLKFSLYKKLEEQIA